MATRSELDILGEAVAATEQELFAGAFEKEAVEDETGDQSLEQMGKGLEGQVEGTEDDDSDASGNGAEGDKSEGGEGEGDGEDKAGDKLPRDDKGKVAEKSDAEKAAADKAANDGKVPPGRLREQTERAKTAEAERDTARTDAIAARDEVKALNARLDGILAAMQRQQPAAPKPEASETKPKPDLFEDPQGFVADLTKGFDTKLAESDRRFEQLRVEMSMQSAADKHGETFTKAYEAITTKLNPRNPEDQATIQRIWRSPNPGASLVQWHRNQETLREVGDDPAKFKERVANETRELLMQDPEFRKQLLEELRGEASGAVDGKPRTITRIPPSLNGARGGKSPVSAEDNSDGSDTALFERAWA